MEYVYYPDEIVYNILFICLISVFICPNLFLFHTILLIYINMYDFVNEKLQSINIHTFVLEPIASLVSS